MSDAAISAGMEGPPVPAEIHPAHLRMLWDHAPLAVWVHVELRLVYVNPAGLATLGARDRREVLGRSPQEFIVPEDRHLIVARQQQALIHQKNTPPEVIRFLRIGGEIFYAQEAVWPILLEGTPAVQATFFDLTRTLRAEEALMLSESTREQILESMPGLVWTTQPNGDADYFNRRWYQYTGTDAGANHGFRWTDGLHPEDLPRTWKAWNHCLATGEDYRVEYRLRGADGTYRWFLTRGNALRDPAGRIVRWFGTCMDIQEQKTRAEEIRLLNAELGERVRQRTAELEASNRELEAFSYSVSHDLRAPLRTIDGFSLALEEDFGPSLNADGLKYIQRIRAGVQHMGVLIDALLQLSRVTRAEIQRQDVDLSAMARGIANELMAQDPAHPTVLRIEEGMLARCDERLMRVALENLIGNAFKFSGKCPESVIEVGSRRTSTGTEYFVRDNGAGFDMQYGDKLFNAFQRLHGDKDFKGSGIGLATVARVVRRHGGAVRAEGAVGRGATFYFTLGNACPESA